MENAWRKIILPWLRIVTYVCLGLTILLSLSLKIPPLPSTIVTQRWIAVHSLRLLFGGLPLIALGLGFFSLLAFKTTKERLLIIALMTGIAWLTTGYQFYL